MRFQSGFFPLAVVLALTTFVAAQSTSSLHGAVSDSKGGVIPDASVTLSNSATGFTRTTKTDGQRQQVVGAFAVFSSQLECYSASRIAQEGEID